MQGHIDIFYKTWSLILTASSLTEKVVSIFPMSSPTASPQKPSNSRLCLRLFYWTFCLVMRLLFGAIVGILVIAVVAISLSICVFSCRPNAWGLLRGEWLGVVREGLSTSSHSVSNCGFATHHPPPTPQRPPTINPLYPTPTTHQAELSSCLRSSLFGNV